jgi:uncharacterized protein (DUF1800 family)
MKQEYFLSQRLGFTNAQADVIKAMGVEKFLKAAMDAPFTSKMPAFLENAPKNRKEYRDIRRESEEDKKVFIVAEAMRNIGVAHWWQDKMYTQNHPLREKMVLFWHNHFVSSFQKVKSAWAIYQQNQLFREHAFGNFRELTRQILYNNAMIIYLDNTQNKGNAINENLSRELLELFTLGVGNYSEQDIKEGAKALAGLNVGEEKAQYYPRFANNGDKTYLGKTGNWKVDDMVKLIFQHPKAAHRITEKLLKYFVSDTPLSTMVEEYAIFLKREDFEIKPFLEKLVRDERFLKSQGQKIKDPLNFMLQTCHEFQLDLPQAKRLIPYFQAQGMILLNPPNVKGWDGGRAWMSSQRLLQRVGVVSLLSSGKTLESFKIKGEKRQDEALDMMHIEEETVFGKPQSQKLPVFKWDKALKNNKDIIKSISDRLIFTVSADMQQDMERILKYDFNPTEPNAQQAITRLAEYIMKSPEYQIC